MTRSVEIAKAMAVAGFDWLFLDMEHGVMSLEACAQISTAALDAGIAPIARVPNGEYAIATRALDNGALGIVMPHVDSAAEAREVVNRLKYPPVGHRSMGGIGPHYGLRSASSGEAAAALMAGRSLQPAGGRPPHRSRASGGPPYRRRGQSGLLRSPRVFAASTSCGGQEQRDGDDVRRAPMRGNEPTRLEDTDLVSKGMHLDNPFASGVQHAAEFAADA
jgi:hypothetical protein